MGIPDAAPGAHLFDAPPPGGDMFPGTNMRFTPETPDDEVVIVGSESLSDRVNDAEMMLRYFRRRDEMNAEVHNDGSREYPNVRYSPITVAAERVVGWLYAQLYIEPPLV